MAKEIEAGMSGQDEAEEAPKKPEKFFGVPETMDQFARTWQFAHFAEFVKHVDELAHMLAAPQFKDGRRHVKRLRELSDTIEDFVTTINGLAEEERGEKASQS